MALFAQIDGSGIVQRVVVCDTAQWLIDRLVGTWVETVAEDVQQQYAGIAMGYDPEAIAKFAPLWVRPVPGIFDGYSIGDWTWRNGRLWQSVVDGNVWVPSEFGWRDYTDGNIPRWVQPAGAGDAYALNADVMHIGQQWRSNVPANVWEPGARGITQWNVVAPPVQVEEWPAWRPWTSGLNGDLYQIGAKVTHNARRWIATTGNNHWTPGVFGWAVQP